MDAPREAMTNAFAVLVIILGPFKCKLLTSKDLAPYGIRNI